MERDHLMVTGKKAWHGIGTVVQDAPTPNAALKIAKLDWMVEPCPLYALREVNSEMVRIPIETNVANVRSDTGEPLGVVSDSYGIVQNTEIADLIWAAAEEGACPKVESAGSMRNGRLVFFCCVMKSLFIGRGDDEVVPYFTLSSSHDGTRALRGLGHSHRVVCANTERIARNESDLKGHTVSLRHSRNIKDRVGEIKTMFAAVKHGVTVYEEKANALVAKAINSTDLQSFFVDVYEFNFGAIPNSIDRETKEGKRKHRRCVATVSKWLENFESPTCNNNGVGGTAWAALNAVTEWDNHQRTVKATATHGHDKDSARQYQRMFNGKFSSAAMDRALQMI